MIVLSLIVIVLGFNIVSSQNVINKENQRAIILTEAMIERYESEIAFQKNLDRLKAVKKSYKEYIRNILENEEFNLDELTRERLSDADLSL